MKQNNLQVLDLTQNAALQDRTQSVKIQDMTNNKIWKSNLFIGL